MSLILFAFLILQDDVPTFTAELDRRLKAGADPKELLQELEKFAERRVGDDRLRLIWNRAHLKAAATVTDRFLDALRQLKGQRVEISSKRRVAGKLIEVTNETLTLETESGRVDLEIASLDYDSRLANAIRLKAMPEACPEAALFRAAAGDDVAALASAEKLTDAAARKGTFDALASLILQKADRDLAAGQLVKVAEEFLKNWVKKEALAAALGGAFGQFAHGTLPVQLAEAAGKPKADKRLLDLASALAGTPEARAQIFMVRWKALKSGEWLPVALDGSVAVETGIYEAGKIVLQAPKGSNLSLQVGGLPVPLDKLGGIRFKFHLESARMVGLDWVTSTGDAHSVLIFADTGEAMYNYHSPGKKDEMSPPGPDVGRRRDYNLRIETESGRLKFYVDDVQVWVAPGGDEPCRNLRIAFLGGKAEVTAVQIRKK